MDRCSATPLRPDEHESPAAWLREPFQMPAHAANEISGERDGSRLLEDIDRPRDHQSQNHEGADGLHSHNQFGPAGQRHHIGRAERGGVGEAEVEVVEEFRAPARRAYLRVELLGEGEVGELLRG